MLHNLSPCVLWCSRWPAPLLPASSRAATPASPVPNASTHPPALTTARDTKHARHEHNTRTRKQEQHRSTLRMPAATSTGSSNSSVGPATPVSPASSAASASSVSAGSAASQQPLPTHAHLPHMTHTAAHTHHDDDDDDEADDDAVAGGAAGDKKRGHGASCQWKTSQHEAFEFAGGTRRCGTRAGICVTHPTDAFDRGVLTVACA